MKNQVGILMVMAFSLGIGACGNSSNGGTGKNIADTNSTNVRMMDSGANATPAQGMGDSTLVSDTNRSGSTPGNANDSVK